MECVHCTSKATHFMGNKDPYDPVCDEHFRVYFDTCPHCGVVRQKDDVVQKLVAHASMAGPDEYDEGCSNCMSTGEDEPDPDRDFD